MLEVLNQLDKQDKLVWAELKAVPIKFRALAEEYTPGALHFFNALDMRHDLYGVAGPQNKSRELYKTDTWT